MYCIRRAAFRTAIAASRQVASKASAAPFAAQTAFKAAAVPKQSLIQAARCFSQTARSQNVEEKEQESAPKVEEQVEEQVSEQQPRQSVQRPPRSLPTYNMDNGVFIRNLIFDATDKHLWTAFEKYGEVLDAHVARDARGLSKGYGFVYFSNPESVQEAVRAVDGSFWHGRRVACAPRAQRDQSFGSGPTGRGFANRPTEPTTTLYIGNIPYETTDAELNRLFRDLSNVVDIRVAVDRTTGWPRGFAHADFANLDSAIKAFEALQGVQLGERTLTVDYSDSRKTPRN